MSATINILILICVAWIRHSLVGSLTRWQVQTLVDIYLKADLPRKRQVVVSLLLPKGKLFALRHDTSPKRAGFYELYMPEPIDNALTIRLTSGPGVLNHRAADRYRSVAQSVPCRTWINKLFLFYLLFKSGTYNKGGPTTWSTVGKRRRKYEE